MPSVHFKCKSRTLVGPLISASLMHTWHTKRRSFSFLHSIPLLFTSLAYHRKNRIIVGTEGARVCFLFCLFLAALFGLWYLSSLIRVCTLAPGSEVKAWSPNHWTAREFPNFSFLLNYVKTVSCPLDRKEFQ